jgi:hypothetical protein
MEYNVGELIKFLETVPKDTRIAVSTSHGDFILQENPQLEEAGLGINPEYPHNATQEQKDAVDRLYNEKKKLIVF